MAFNAEVAEGADGAEAEKADEAPTAELNEAPEARLQAEPWDHGKSWECVGLIQLIMDIIWISWLIQFLDA